MEEPTTHSHEESTDLEPELRLVLLGFAGSGKSSVGNAVLGFKAFETRLSAESQKPVTQQCERKCGTVAGKKVAVIDTPDWFFSERPPKEVQGQLSLCKSLSGPGPHAFLLCVSVHRPGEQDLQALDALEKVFGPEALSKHTVVLFTRAERLSEDLPLEELLSGERKDLQEVVARCGNRYQVLELEEDDGKSVEKLLEKVEEMVNESGEEFYTFPSLKKADSEIRGTEGNEEPDLSSEIMCRKRGGGGEGGDEEEQGSEKAEKVSADDQEAVGDEDTTLSPPGPPPSFLRWMWDSVVGWVLWIPSLLRGSTLLGSFVGLFVGGVFGGVMGATVGSVATEVGRRKPQKAKEK
ncbi:GTPase IMAP family member 1 [Astyanax mexicanus]|uniref:GTPase IMAP family member 1 n=1 Tax=Astyanax mexicanus TaxID=7994 RepID=UPI0020CB016A|nr:GTPase IMAP family member 1 [Astyanax mexicanus]